MTRRLLLLLLACLVVGQTHSQEAPTDLNDLSMEVTALHTLVQLNLTPAQLKSLAVLSKTTADRRKREAVVKGFPKLRKLLPELREALIKGDEKQIDALTAKVEALHAALEKDLDDEVNVTEAARKRAPEVLASMTPKQVAGYLARYHDDWKGPDQRIRDALKEGQKLSVEDWKQLRDLTADEVAWVLAGADATAANEARTKASNLLIRFHKSMMKEFKGEKPDLEKALAKLIGSVGPVQQLKNAMERDLAELLSNPRLVPAIRASVLKRKK